VPGLRRGRAGEPAPGTEGGVIRGKSNFARMILVDGEKYVSVEDFRRALSKPEVIDRSTRIFTQGLIRHAAPLPICVATAIASALCQCAGEDEVAEQITQARSGS
jgi:hypothetical protein